jgi:hypothetical protein
VEIPIWDGLSYIAFDVISGIPFWDTHVYVQNITDVATSPTTPMKAKIKSQTSLHRSSSPYADWGGIPGVI